MAIYRGPGGPGDATTDAGSTAALISTLVTQAETAATNAASSSSSASTSASNASTSATNASNSASAAATSASNASTSATNAANSATAAASSASTASTAATNASNSASAAATSASNAATSETNAAASASAAATSATNASNSASAAATSASNAAASYDAFDDRYLGAKSFAPTLDNDGNALLTGALYWNTSSNQLYVWDGSAWDAAAFNVTSLGDVIGPASATDNAVARFDGTTGTLIQNSSFVVNDSGEVTTGVWKGTEITVPYGGTGLSAYSVGDLLYASSSTTLSALTKGTYQRILTAGVSVPEWTLPANISVGNADKVTITPSSTNTNFYLAFAFGSGSNYVQIDGGGNATYNPSTNTLTVPNFVGALTGNASTVTNGVYTTDTGTVTNTMLAGSIANNKLVNSSVTIGTTTINLGDTTGTLVGLSGGTGQTGAGTTQTLRVGSGGIAVGGDSYFANSIGIVGTVTAASFVGTLTGNASTATTLQTARTIQTNLASTSSASFNGSANITPGVTGTLAVGNGGTGATTLTGVIKGNGTSAFSAATAGTDYVAPGTATTFTAQQTFKELKDTVHTITDGAAFEIDPANGSIQIVTLGANRTPAATNFEAGQVVLLGIDDGAAYTITWTTVNPTWVKAGGTASAPTLATTGYTWILLWEVGTTIYATEVGKP